MPDNEPLPITPIHFEQHTVHTVESWPERTSFTDEWLTMAHAHSATYDTDLVTFKVFNGKATYRLRRDLPRQGPAIVADLLDGNVTRRKVKG